MTNPADATGTRRILSSSDEVRNAVISITRQAEEMYRRTLHTEEKIGRLIEVGDECDNLARVRLARGDPDEAESLASRALKIFEQLGRRDRVGFAYPVDG